MFYKTYTHRAYTVDPDRMYTVDPDRMYAVDPDRMYTVDPDRMYAVDPDRMYTVDPDIIHRFLFTSTSHCVLIVSSNVCRKRYFFTRSQTEGHKFQVTSVVSEEQIQNKM
jgi:hypothetical protein